MNIRQNKLINLDREIPKVEETKEGLLKGGFIASSLSFAGSDDLNTNCNGCNANCPKCEQNDVCTTETTEETTEPTVTILPENSSFISSMLF